MRKTQAPKDNDTKVPCGLYRTTQPIEGKVPAGALVYYHSHGDPGPGVYPVDRWSHNKAVFFKQGILIPDERYAHTLVPLREEGFYRVTEEFYCCEKKCRLFEKETLVQLGYNGAGEPILFVPEWSFEGLHLPEKGTPVAQDQVRRLDPVKVVFKFHAGVETFGNHPASGSTSLLH